MCNVPKDGKETGEFAEASIRVGEHRQMGEVNLGGKRAPPHYDACTTKVSIGFLGALWRLRNSGKVWLSQVYLMLVYNKTERLIANVFRRAVGKETASSRIEHIQVTNLIDHNTYTDVLR